nr:MAG TPA: Cell wall hydrolase autolysin [Caudoviricetes sp.]
MAKIYLSPSSQHENPYAYGGTNEAAQCMKIALAAADALKRSGFEVSVGGGTMYQRVPESNKWGADLHVAIHTNAANGKTTGTRCYAWKTGGDGFRAAQAIFNVLAPITPGVSEGVFEQRGWYEIKNTKAPCAYVECEFHDVPETAKWIVEHTTEIGEAIAQGICNFYGVAYVHETLLAPETPAQLYRVQCGAFSKKENAEALVARLKAAGFDAIIK